MKFALLVLVSLVLVSCAGKKSSESSEAASNELQETWIPKIGTATKGQFVEKFGTAQWCKKAEYGSFETCRFYNKKGVVWMGDAMNRKSYNQYDEVIAEFDASGKLRSVESAAQR